MRWPRRAYERAFAFGLHHLGFKYRRFLDARKPELFAGLAGDVLEIGSGTGGNLPFLSGLARYVGVDRNVHMHRYAHARAADVAVPVFLSCADANRLPFRNSCFDAVIATLVLCSAADPAGVLQEIRRVLKPGGRYVFLEHVAAAADSRQRRWQERCAPVWRVLGDGCSPARDTERTIRAAGFARVEVTPFTVPVPVFSPHISGQAYSA